MRIQLVLFDLDGTLLDTLDDLSNAVNHAMELRGFPLHTPCEYMKMIGNGVRKLIIRALPESHKNDEALVDAALADFKTYYTAHIDVNTRPYPGMPELLAKLHQEGVKMAVVSNKFQEGTDYLIRKFFHHIPFVAVLGNRPGYPLKPDPQIVEEVLRLSGATRDGTLMVGDSLTDMETARNSGIRAVAVGWGYRDLRGTPGLTVVDTASDLLSAISNL